MSLFQPGTIIERREALHGQVWLSAPVTVVSDADGVLGVRMDPGSKFTFPAHPYGRHPWSRFTEWGGSTVLQLFRADDYYAVWKVFETDGTFPHWYINFEAPVARGGAHIDTEDYGLDLIIASDGSWQWKDVTDLHHQRIEGRIDGATVLSVLAAAAVVEEMLSRDSRWWAPWDDWIP